MVNHSYLRTVAPHTTFVISQVIIKIHSLFSFPHLLTNWTTWKQVLDNFSYFGVGEEKLNIC